MWQMKITTTEDMSSAECAGFAATNCQRMAANPTEENFRAYLAHLDQFVANPQNSVGIDCHTNDVGIKYGSGLWEFHKLVRREIQLARITSRPHNPCIYTGTHFGDIKPEDLIRRTQLDEAEKNEIDAPPPATGSYSCGQYSVHADDMKRLNDGELLDDSILDLYLALCYARSRPRDVFMGTAEIKYYLHNKTGRSTAKGPDKFDYIAAGEFVKPARPLRRAEIQSDALVPSIFDQRMLLYPMNSGGNHWILVYVDLALKEMTLLDSMYWGPTKDVEVPGEPDTGPSTPDSTIRRFHCLRRILHHEHIQMYGVAIPFAGWRYIQLGGESIRKQDNGYDCGVYTCLFGNLLLNWLERAGPDKPVPSDLFAGIKTDDIPLARKQMKLDLRRNRIHPDPLRVDVLD